MALMKQVEELKAELATAAKNSDHSPGEFTDQVRAYEQTIQELRSELAEATAAANQAQNNEATSPNADESKLLSIISELKEKLHEQSLEISELTNSRAVDGANAAGSDDGSHSVEELHTLHKELDERTNLLDGREEEIRERKRKLEQSEEEIESQRRQLLEARQQLEQARAEIQLAMQSRNTESDDSDSHVDLDDDFAPHHSRTRSIEREEQRAPAVRSEIAELFGIKVCEKKQEEKLPERVESLLPAVDDYSQEAAAAVSMSFTRAESVLLEAPPKVADTKEEPVKSEDGDDFVASYMEQLLSRNREKAGGSPPQELKKPGQKSSGSAHASSQPQKPAASAPEAKKPAVQKSFIDSYMSGAYDSETVSAVAEVTAEAYEEPQKAPKRAKIDLDSLRSNMDSFRELSTRSVENALASHAKRQEKGGITARSTIFISLSVVTLLVTVAAVLSVIPFGVPVWLLILATIASGAELYVKMSAIKKKVQTKSVTLTKGTNQDGSVSVPQARQDAPQRPAAVLDMDGSQKTEVAGPIEAPEVLDAADMIEAKPPAAQREEEKYFEL